MRKWRKRGAADCLDRSVRPHQLPWKASEDERASVCALHRATNLALDDLIFVNRHFLSHLNRDSIWRILKAEGIDRWVKPVSERPANGQGTFRDYNLGFVHIDIKHLPKLQTSEGARRKRHLFVAIDRCSRSVHVVVNDKETKKSAIAFLREVAAAFPFQITHVLTDNGSCFTPAFAKACVTLGAQCWHIKIVSWNNRCAVSTPLTTLGVSEFWRARHQTRSSPTTSKPNQTSPTLRRTVGQLHAMPPKHALSQKLPRRSYSRTNVAAWVVALALFD